MTKDVHYRGVVWPVLLIGAGLLLLLNNLGYLPWDIWSVLWRLWPVLLIAAGLEIVVGRRSTLGSLLVALFLMAILFGVIFWGLRQQTGAQVAPILASMRADMQTVEISQSAESTDEAVIDIGFGAGQLLIDALPESPNLIEGKIELRNGERAKPEFKLNGGVAQFTLRSEDPDIIPTLGQWNSGETWDLALNRDIPTRLNLTAGAGEAKLDLSRLNLKELNVETGVGATQLYLPRQGRLNAVVHSGVGEVTIIIPPDMAANIEIDSGLSGIEVTGKEYRNEGNRYISPGFEGASDRVNLKVEAGVGKIVIR